MFFLNLVRPKETDKINWCNEYIYPDHCRLTRYSLASLPKLSFSAYIWFYSLQTEKTQPSIKLQGCTYL